MDSPLSSSEVPIASGLDPLILPLMLRHRAAVQRAGIPYWLVSGRRSRSHQELLYRRAQERRAEWEEGGRVGPEPRPAAQPGRSKHELGMAYDFGGPQTAAEWAKAGELAEGLGLESGHRYGDPGHVEVAEPFEHLVTLVTLRVAAVAGLVWVVAHD